MVLLEKRCFLCSNSQGRSLRTGRQICPRIFPGVRLSCSPARYRDGERQKDTGSSESLCLGPCVASVTLLYEDAGESTALWVSHWPLSKHDSGGTSAYESEKST